MPKSLKKSILYSLFFILIISFLYIDKIKFFTETTFSIKTANDNTGNINKIINENQFIAHAGGGIDGKKYTNSKEAVLNSISKNYKLIELDLLITSDGSIVAAHDWISFKEKTGFSDKTESPIELKQFNSAKIHGKYQTLDIKKINDIFENNKNIYLVTDKIRNFKKLGSSINYKDRVIVEVFSIDEYNKAIDEGFTNIALNIRRIDSNILKFLTINKISAVTLGYYSNKKISIEDINKLCSSGVAIMIYSDDDSNLSTLHNKTNCNNIAIYVDFLDIENWNYKK